MRPILLVDATGDRGLLEREFRVPGALIEAMENPTLAADDKRRLQKLFGEFAFYI